MDDEARLGELSEALDELDLIGMDDPVLTAANKTIKLKGRLTTTTNETTDTTRDLTELWDAMGEVGIRPKAIFISLVYDATHLRINIGGVDHGFDSELDPDSPWWQHALDILTGHAERWLRGRGWGYEGWDGGSYWYQEDTGMVCYFDSLPAAIRAECGRGK